MFIPTHQVKFTNGESVCVMLNMNEMVDFDREYEAPTETESMYKDPAMVVFSYKKGWKTKNELVVETVTPYRAGIMRQGNNDEEVH